MRIVTGVPGIKRILLVTVGLLIVSLMLPVGISGRTPLFYLIAQSCLSGGVFILAVFQALKRKRGIRHITTDLSANVTICAAAGVVVQALYAGVPLIPLIFFVGYPYTVFARRFGLFWVPRFYPFSRRRRQVPVPEGPGAGFLGGRLSPLQRRPRAPGWQGMEGVSSICGPS